MSEPKEQQSRRRSAAGGRRVDLLVGIALALVAIVALGLAAIGNESDRLAGPQGPRTESLTASTVVCPGATVGSSSVRVTRVPGSADGELDVRTPAPTATTLGGGKAVDVVAPRTVDLPGSVGATVIEGRGAAAPGVIAGRGEGAAVPECRAPGFDEWLVDLGASARYSSTLELVNPDAGIAVVDLALHGGSGPINEPSLRGIQVPPNGIKRVELAKVAPRAAIFSARMTVVRGRVAVAARNTIDSLGVSRVTSDFLPAQATAGADNLLLGLPAKPTGAALLLVNPGEDEVRATIKFVTGDATFVPSGVPDVAVPPGSLRVVSLQEALSTDTAKGVVGLQIASTGPVAASARVTNGGDLILLGSDVAVREPTAAILGPGVKTLLLGGAQRAGVVHVRTYDAAGKELADESVEIAPDRAPSLALPAGTTVVEVEPRNTVVNGVVRVVARRGERGTSVIRLRPAETRTRVPAVGPK